MKNTIILIAFCFVQIVTAQIKTPEPTSIKNNPVSYTEKVYLLDSTNHKKLIEKREVFKNFDELKLTHYSEKKYDSIRNIYNDKNVLIEQEIYRYYQPDNSFYLDNIKVFTYNTAGLLEKIDHKKKRLTKVRNHFTYKFDENNNIKTIKKYHRQKLRVIINFTYTNGQLTKKTQRSYENIFSDKNVSLDKEKINYFKYDKKGRLIEETTIHNYDYFPSYSNKFTYNDKDEIIKIEVFAIEKSDKKKTKPEKLSSIYYKKFDKFGNPTVIKSEIYTEEKTEHWIDKRKYQYKK